MPNTHHRIVIIGAGTAGIAVAARLQINGEQDIAIIDPSTKHYYQPLWTLVGGGRAEAGKTERNQSSLIPKGVTWIRDAAAGFLPDERQVQLAGGDTVTYDAVVVCPGIQLDFDQLPGSSETLGKDGVSTNYRFELAPKTWDFIRETTSGTAVFTMPSGPIKCAGAPQKIAYLAADYWCQQGVLKDINMVMVLPTPGMFGVPEFSAVLDQVVDRYGIDVRFKSEVTKLDPEAREVEITDLDEGTTSSPRYDFVHVVPPTERARLDQGQPALDSRRRQGVGRHRQEHDAAGPIPRGVRPRRRRQQPQLEDRSGDPQAGARRRAEPFMYWNVLMKAHGMTTPGAFAS